MAHRMPFSTTASHFMRIWRGTFCSTVANAITKPVLHMVVRDGVEQAALAEEAENHPTLGNRLAEEAENHPTPGNRLAEEAENHPTRGT